MPSKTCPRGLLPLERLHLPKFPEFSKIASTREHSRQKHKVNIPSSGHSILLQPQKARASQNAKSIQFYFDSTHGSHLFIETGSVSRHLDWPQTHQAEKADLELLSLLTLPLKC